MLTMIPNGLIENQRQIIQAMQELENTEPAEEENKMPLIQITDLDGGDDVTFPMLPTEINVQAGASFQSYNIMGIGEVKVPSGESLSGFSWRGMLPGEGRKPAPYMAVLDDKDKLTAHQIQSIWSKYRLYKRKLHLLVTGTPINHNVYLESYNVTYKDGNGDYHYQISFIAAKDLKVHTASASAESGLPNQSQEQQRSEPPKPQTYTIQKGDCLYNIAQKFLGAGNRYPEIHKINQPPLGPDPGKIPTGVTIKIP